MLLPRLNMMIRENARLLFLYALRSNASCEEALRPNDFYFRLARRGDIGAIRECNLKTLPENYTPQFYETHIGDWPELALVAEHVKRHGGDQAEVVGYVLGRMEDKQLFPGIRDPRINNTPTGHVTSLAVLPGYRRCGVAHQLMTRLHEQMESCYQAKKVSLHVRKSNRGAIRLYEQVLGYEVDSVAKSYYSDGEDAYLMQVELPLKDGVRTASSSLQSTENHATPLLSGAVTRSTTEGVVALPTLDPETSTSGVGAAAAASPVMRAATLPGLGAGGGGGGGHEGLKGVPAGHSFRSLCWELPRRPGIGCGGTVAGRCAGWARGGGIDSFLNRSL